MILFFDTETTGKADFQSRPDASHQPRIVQLACLLIDDTADWEEVAHFNLIIKPDGWTIPEEASAIHGITTERAALCGVPEIVALQVFDCLLMQSTIACAHNFSFDCFMLSRGSTIRRRELEKRIYCTMESMTSVCKLPGKYGFKWPKLQEAHTHCFGSEFDGAHDALADVRACARIYRWLQERKVAEVSACADPIR